MYEIEQFDSHTFSVTLNNNFLLAYIIAKVQILYEFNKKNIDSFFSKKTSYMIPSTSS